MFASATFNNGLTSLGWNPINCIIFSNMFQAANAFNQRIFYDPLNPSVMFSFTGSSNLSSMFRNNTLFNQNIGNWDVSRATNMSFMFSGASAFNNGGSDTINNWNPSNVSNFSSMFGNASSFNQPIGNWITTSATNMANMFNNAFAFNQNITISGNSWNTSLVTSFSSMFAMSTANQGAFNNGQIGGTTGINPLYWITTSATNLSNMFRNCINFNQNVTTSGNIWNTTLVTNVTSMFAGVSASILHKFNNGQDIGGTMAPMGWTFTTIPSGGSTTAWRTNCVLTTGNKPVQLA
jgi:surface protein